MKFKDLSPGDWFEINTLRAKKLTEKDRMCQGELKLTNAEIFDDILIGGELRKTKYYIFVTRGRTVKPLKE